MYPLSGMFSMTKTLSQCGRKTKTERKRWFSKENALVWTGSKAETVVTVVVTKDYIIDFYFELSDFMGNVSSFSTQVEISTLNNQNIFSHKQRWGL